MKLIIAVHPVRESYSQKSFLRHCRYISQLCSNKKIGYIFVDSALSNEDDRNYEDEDYERYVGRESSEIVESYWSDLIDSLEESKIFPDFLGSYSDSLNTEPRSYNIYEQVEDNYTETREYFNDVFSFPRKIARFMFNQDYDVVITDLYIGQNLQETFPNEFRIVYEHPPDFAQEKRMRLAKARILEYKFFLKWKNRENPRVIGNWKPEGKGYNDGRFYLYTFSGESKSDPMKMVPVEGIISDKTGLYWFRGHINKYRIIFKKQHFEPYSDTEDIPMEEMKQVIWFGDGTKECDLEDGENSSNTEALN